LPESFHVVTFEAATLDGVVTRETRIFYIDAPAPAAAAAVTEIVDETGISLLEVTEAGFDANGEAAVESVGNSGESADDSRGCSTFGYLAFALFALPFVLKRKN